MLHMFKAGGPFMWPILLCSILGIGVVIEKAVYFFTKERDLTKDFVNEVSNLIKSKNQIKLIEVCRKKENSVAKVLLTILDKFDIGKSNKNDINLEEISREATLEQISFLEKGMWLLGTVVPVAPQLGLLGTVTGMITALSALSGNSIELSSQIAAGISEALYTTAAGMIVGIPALVLYNFFNRKIDKILIEIEKVTVNLVNTSKNS